MMLFDPQIKSQRIRYRRCRDTCLLITRSRSRHDSNRPIRCSNRWGILDGKLNVLSRKLCQIHVDVQPLVTAGGFGTHPVASQGGNYRGQSICGKLG